MPWRLPGQGGKGKGRRKGPPVPGTRAWKSYAKRMIMREVEEMLDEEEMEHKTTTTSKKEEPKKNSPVDKKKQAERKLPVNKKQTKAGIKRVTPITEPRQSKRIKLKDDNNSSSSNNNNKVNKAIVSVASGSAVMNNSRPIPDSGSAVMNNNNSRPIPDPTLVPRALGIIRWLLPRVTNTQWKVANGLSPRPSGLSKHVRDSIMVFNFQTTDTGNPLIGATMYRLNYKKTKPTYDLQCRVYMELHKFSAGIVQRWTDWIPNANSLEGTGIFIHMLDQLYYNKNIHVFRNEGALKRADESGKLNYTYERSLFIFEQDALWMK